MIISFFLNIKYFLLEGVQDKQEILHLWIAPTHCKVAPAPCKIFRSTSQILILWKKKERRKSVSLVLKTRAQIRRQRNKNRSDEQKMKCDIYTHRRSCILLPRTYYTAQMPANSCHRPLFWSPSLCSPSAGCHRCTVQVQDAICTEEEGGGSELRRIQPHSFVYAYTYKLK